MLYRAFPAIRTLQKLDWCDKTGHPCARVQQGCSRESIADFEFYNAVQFFCTGLLLFERFLFFFLFILSWRISYTASPTLVHKGRQAVHLWSAQPLSCFSVILQLDPRISHTHIAHPCHPGTPIAHLQHTYRHVYAHLLTCLCKPTDTPTAHL